MGDCVGRHLLRNGIPAIMIPIQREPSTQLHPPRTKLHISIPLESTGLDTKVLHHRQQSALSAMEHDLPALQQY